MTRKEPEADILCTPVWELENRWKTQNFYDAQTRRHNLTSWAYHAFPFLMKHRLRNTEWITETHSYEEALSQLRGLILALEPEYASDKEGSQFEEGRRLANLEIARLQAYLVERQQADKTDLR